MQLNIYHVEGPQIEELLPEAIREPADPDDAMPLNMQPDANMQLNNEALEFARDLRLNIERNGLSQGLLTNLDGIEVTNIHFIASVIRIVIDFYMEGYDYRLFNMNGRNNRIRFKK